MEQHRRGKEQKAKRLPKVSLWGWSVVFSGGLVGTEAKQDCTLWEYRAAKSKRTQDICFQQTKRSSEPS